MLPGVTPSRRSSDSHLPEIALGWTPNYSHPQMRGSVQLMGGRDGAQKKSLQGTEWVSGMTRAALPGPDLPLSAVE